MSTSHASDISILTALLIKILAAQSVRERPGFDAARSDVSQPEFWTAGFADANVMADQVEAKCREITRSEHELQASRNAIIVLLGMIKSDPARITSQQLSAALEGCEEITGLYASL